MPAAGIGKNPPKGRPFEALLFDGGGTLFFFEGDMNLVRRQASAALVASLHSSRLQLDDDFLLDFDDRLNLYYEERESEFIEYTTAYLLRTLLAERGYGELPESILKQALRAMYAVTQAHWQPETDAVSTLETLHGQGYRLAMLSNAADDQDVQTLVDKAGLRSLFEFVLTSAAAGIRKPNPRLFAIALQKLGIPAPRAAMVGDTLGADILGAQNAGVFSIWITRRAAAPANREHADTIRPQAVIEKLSDLPGLLESIINVRGSSA